MNVRVYKHCSLFLCVCHIKMEDLNLPEIKRKKIEEKKAEDKKEFKGLFQSDSDSDEDDDAGLKIKCELTPHLSESGPAKDAICGLVQVMVYFPTWPLGGCILLQQCKSLRGDDSSL